MRSGLHQRSAIPCRDAAYCHQRYAQFGARLLQQSGFCYHGTGFDTGRKKRAKRHVICPGIRSLSRQRQAIIARDADDFLLAQQRTRYRQSAILCAEMHAVRVHLGCQICIIIHDERHGKIA